MGFDFLFDEFDGGGACDKVLREFAVEGFFGLTFGVLEGCERGVETGEVVFGGRVCGGQSSDGMVEIVQTDVTVFELSLEGGDAGYSFLMLMVCLSKFISSSSSV